MIPLPLIMFTSFPNMKTTVDVKWGIPSGYTADVNDANSSNVDTSTSPQ